MENEWTKRIVEYDSRTYKIRVIVNLSNHSYKLYPKLTCKFVYIYYREKSLLYQNVFLARFICLISCKSVFSKNIELKTILLHNIGWLNPGSVFLLE